MAKKEELLDLQKIGRSAYEAKNYTDAMGAFSNAIVLAREWSPSEVLPLLDQRIAVYVKLGNLAAARKDAMAMIRTSKSNGRGYLRCGQLDRLEENPSAALKWYEHGVKQVPESDPLHSAIKIQLKKTKALLEKKLTSTNSRDPLSTLPAELFQFVLAYLDYIDVVRALRVSKDWNKTLSSLRPLIDTVDFSDTERLISHTMMVAALKRLKPYPKVIVTKDLTNPALKLLRMNLERWQNYTQLEKLSIPARVFDLGLLPFEKYRLKNLSIETWGIQESMVIEIMKACHCLVNARISNIQGCLGAHPDASSAVPLLFPTVRTLKLGGNESSSSLLIYPSFFTASFPNVQEIFCHHMKVCRTPGPFDLSELSDLHTLKFVDSEIPWWPKLPPSIEIWDNHRTSTFGPAIEQVNKLAQLAKLRFLRFHHTSPPPQVSSFLPKLPSKSVTFLDLRGTYAYSVDPGHFTLLELIESGHLSDVRELAFDGVRDNERVSKGLASLSSLEVLSLTGSSMNGGHLIELIKRPGNQLRQISLIDCHNISAETIAWARSQGIMMLPKSEQTRRR